MGATCGKGRNQAYLEQGPIVDSLQSANVWFSRTIGAAPYTMLISFRGQWFLVDLNKLLPKDGVNFVVWGAMTAEHAARLRQDKDLRMEITSDPHHHIAQGLKERFGIDIPLSTQTWRAGCPNGYIQPAMALFDSAGQALWSWVMRPKASNGYGATFRPKPSGLMLVLDAVKSGTEIPEPKLLGAFSL
eukprot:gene8027-1432_t